MKSPETNQQPSKLKRVLIVEDQADLRRLIALTLGVSTYDLAEAADADQALATLSERRPDLVILDMMLPNGRNGLEICRFIKGTPGMRDIPVVMMTASNQADQRERVLDAGADHYIPKPFSPRQLRELVASLLA